MQFSFTTLVAFTGFCATVFGSPIVEVQALKARTDTDVKSLMVDLYVGIQIQTKIINETIDGIDEHCTAAQNASAQATISASVEIILSSINESKDACSAVSNSDEDDSSDSISEEDELVIKAYAELVIYECAGTFLKVDACFGEEFSQGLLVTILDALKGLFASLDLIIAGVLDLALGLIDGLLETVLSFVGSTLNFLFGGWGHCGHCS
ncbi:hypothetical protein PVAG01_07959 [Phlyctema vagabunda]|uniref:Uncharacterized protein n=1 Tax=Phlyctema vagabunda TaxID=108571 RepID=A0ABR4PE06_9HELO